jgi:tetratricopeptide (TPR) repeat protein
VASHLPARDERFLFLANAAAQLESAEETRSFLRAVCAEDPRLASDITRSIDSGSVPRSSADPVAPGQFVAGRFRLIRRLGEGGMGVVYEAVDTKLGERRALKFAKDGYSHSISPEARSALRVTHNNICRIHEIHTADSGSGSTDFISMEFVDGETLASRCRRENVAHDVAVEIARQLCRGIEAAHEARILHRDLKSANVMLTSNADGSLRAVITDFGLARALGSDGSRPLFVSGTPAYIAPECWKGSPPSPASDIYALGVILYELITGRLPFPAGTDWTRRLTVRPEAPSRSPRGPDTRWDGIVLRCLEPDPGKRFSTAAAVLRAVERAFCTSSTRRWLIAASVAVLSATPLMVFRERIWPPPLARLAVAVPGSTGDRALDDAVRGGLSDIARRLESLGAPTRRLTVIPFEESLRNEVKSAAQAAARLGATHTLAVTLQRASDTLTVHATVTDARGGQVLRHFSGTYGRHETAAVSTALTGVVTSAFRLDKAPSTPVAAAAYPHYAAGLAALRRSSASHDAAIAHLQQALASDADSPLIGSALADALLAKFVATKDQRWLTEAAALARRAEARLPDSPEVLLVVGRVEQEEGRPERAVEKFQRAAELEPRSSEAWRRAGSALEAIGRDAEAIPALRRAAELDPGYYSPYLTLGNLHFSAGRYSEAVEQYLIAARLAPDLPEAHANLGGALLAAEKEVEAERALRRSLELRETSHALNNLSVVLRYRGRDEEAAGVLARALQIGTDSARLRLNLANALRRTGREREAREHFQQAKRLARAALLRDPRNASARAQLAFSMVRLGDPAGAVDEALQAVRLASNQYSVLFWAVMTLEAAGRRTDAISLLASASPEQLRDLRRQPDLAQFSRDPRFASLLDARAAVTPKSDERR